MTWEPKKNKKLFFLVAMPRSGNTLFASIMNQNPELVVTPNSITLEIIKDLFLLKETDVFQNYPDHKSLDNVLDSVYDAYYKDWPQRIIIDRGPVITSGNFALMQKHFKRPFKCIVLLNRFNLKSDEEKLSTLMNKEGGLAKELEAIKNAYNYPNICHFVKYDDLVAKPQEEIQKIYQFLDEPYYNHSFENLQQVEVNGIKYDDTIVGKNMHNIRSVVRKVNNPYIEKIPKRIKQKYEHIRF